MVEAAVEEAVAAIEEDGAEVITFGCSATFWLQPFLQQRLCALGWEIPVLEGYSCAIELAKLMVDMQLTASGLAFPSDHPKRWRRKKCSRRSSDYGRETALRYLCKRAAA